MITNNSELLGMAFLVMRDELVAITEEAHAHSWSARFGRNAIEKWVDRENIHLLVPFTRNGAEGPSDPPSYRCYLWFMHANANRRSCVSIDVSKEQLSLLRRPTPEQCDRLIKMLVEGLPVEFLGPYQESV